MNLQVIDEDPEAAGNPAPALEFIDRLGTAEQSLAWKPRFMAPRTIECITLYSGKHGPGKDGVIQCGSARGAGVVSTLEIARCGLSASRARKRGSLSLSLSLSISTVRFFSRAS